LKLNKGNGEKNISKESISKNLLKFVSISNFCFSDVLKRYSLPFTLIFFVKKKWSWDE